MCLGHGNGSVWNLMVQVVGHRSIVSSDARIRAIHPCRASSLYSEPDGFVGLSFQPRLFRASLGRWWRTLRRCPFSPDSRLLLARRIRRWQRKGGQTSIGFPLAVGIQAPCCPDCVWMTGRSQSSVTDAPGTSYAADAYEPIQMKLDVEVEAPLRHVRVSYVSVTVAYADTSGTVW